MDKIIINDLFHMSYHLHQHIHLKSTGEGTNSASKDDLKNALKVLKMHWNIISRSNSDW